MIGFPRPIEAQLSAEGVGGIRNALFEGELVFHETVTKWEENVEIEFDIDVDPLSIPPETLDEHVTIGGEYFDTLSGGYVIEPLKDGSCLLHLQSKHRLSTQFTFYSGLWTESIMSQIQGYILKIIKARCESNH